MTASLANDIAARLQKIEYQIAQSTARCNQQRPVRLVAVTKTFSADVVRAAYAAGIRDFAENKVQEGTDKQLALRDLTGITWHFIGRVQSNKSRKVLANFDWIHSVDSLKLAQRLNQQAQELNRCPTCCLQVKLAPDPNKSGFEPDELLAALPALSQLIHLEIVGLMAITPYGLGASQTQAVFERGRDLAQQLSHVAQQQGWETVQMNELSMGMSGDFDVAIAAGATLVRIGSGLFGQRR